jgi:glutathione S-transferase
MDEILISGPRNAPFVAACLFALEEKGVFYRLSEPDILKSGEFRLSDLVRYQAERQPSLKHGDLVLFDVEAILRYVDEAFPGPILQPEGPRERALMMQIIAVIRAHLHPSGIGIIAAQLLFAPFFGGVPDLAQVERVRPAMVDSLVAIEQLSLLCHDARRSDFLVSNDLCLADILLAPIAHYLMLTEEGHACFDASSRLSRWWLAVAGRPAWARIRPELV